MPVRGAASPILEDTIIRPTGAGRKIGRSKVREPAEPATEPIVIIDDRS